jgi:hypothetical protein
MFAHLRDVNGRWRALFLSIKRMGVPREGTPILTDRGAG